MRGLVLVSGLPACGKSTLARRLGDDLGLPVLCRDRLRNRAFGQITERLPDDEQWRVGRTIDLLLNELAAELLRSASGAVIDSNFNWAPQIEAVRSLVRETGAPCIEVCLWADADECRRRFIARGDPPWDDAIAPHFEAAVARDREPVLCHGEGPVIEVDTTSFAELDARYGSILDAVRANLTPPRPTPAPGS